MIGTQLNVLTKKQKRKGWKIEKSLENTIQNDACCKKPYKENKLNIQLFLKNSTTEPSYVFGGTVKTKTYSKPYWNCEKLQLFYMFGIWYTVNCFLPNENK